MTAAVTDNCIRCGRELNLNICAEEFLPTGVCSDCWNKFDDELEPWEIYDDINYDAAMMDPEANR